jgi:hypothetical protein
LNVALPRTERGSTILQEVIQNQAVSLEEFMAAHTPNAAVTAETEYTVDTNFVEALDVVLQEHQQEHKDATANFVDCQEELNTSDEKQEAVKEGGPTNEGDDEDKEATESSTEESEDDDQKKMPAVSSALPLAIPPVITVQRKDACCCGCG